jgi:mRNA interferase MazF
LVLSNAEFNGRNANSILAMITTAARSSWPSDLAIADLSSAGLPRACVLRWKIFTLPNDLIQRRIGSLSASDRSTVSAMHRSVFGP